MNPNELNASYRSAGFAKLEEIVPGHVREARRLVVDALTPEQPAALGDAARAITAVTMAEQPEMCWESGDC
ncbi:hypothetical protein ACFFV7_53475 [Nonomuraea spiralis]|uniref:Uncharacterized protein n=1 Tax=Nonomuraea spiralis TaxID=46182 RepID=A0ABV5J1M2_9ACTN|nr:hypothetical protein [Nonomuraea spiralis]GGT16209.1 hypothetical protein GCM10010176_070900 [Nonomuraea spiralis]